MPPSAPVVLLMLTTDATALVGNMSEGSVNTLAENPWCAAVARPSSKTAPHVDETRGASIIGSAPNTKTNIAALRLTLMLLPWRIRNDDSQPPATLPAS